MRLSLRFFSCLAHLYSKCAVVDLVFHLLNVDFRQFVIHEKHLDFSGVHLITFRVGRKGFAVVFHELLVKDRAKHPARGRPRGKDLPQQRPRQVAVERGEKAREKLRVQPDMPSVTSSGLSRPGRTNLRAMCCPARLP